MKKLLLTFGVIGLFAFAALANSIYWDDYPGSWEDHRDRQDRAALEQYRRDQERRHRETMQFEREGQQQQRFQQSVPRYRSQSQVPTYLPVPMFDPQLAAVIQQLQAQNANQFNRIAALEHSVQVLRKEIHQLRVASYAQARRKIRPTKRPQDSIDFNDLIPPKGFVLDEPDVSQDPNSNFDFKELNKTNKSKN